MIDSSEWHDRDTRTPWQKYHDRELRRRMRLWTQGMSVKEMAGECGVTKSTMHIYVSTHRDKFPPRREERDTSAEKEIARAMRADGMTFLAIANELDRPVSTVRSWIAKENK